MCRHAMGRDVRGAFVAQKCGGGGRGRGTYVGAQLEHCRRGVCLRRSLRATITPVARRPIKARPNASLRSLTSAAQRGGEFAQHVCGNRPLAALDGQCARRWWRNPPISPTPARNCWCRTKIAGARRNASAAASSMRPPRRRHAATLSRERIPRPRSRRAERRAGARRLHLPAHGVGRCGAGHRRDRVQASASASKRQPRSMRDIRFPRIDGPQTPAIRRFNDLVAQQPQFRLGDATNEMSTTRSPMPARRTDLGAVHRQPGFVSRR